MIPQAKMNEIAGMLRRLANDYEAGKLTPALVAFQDTDGEKAMVLAPLPDAAIMLATLQIALQDAIKQGRLENKSYSSGAVVMGGDLKL